MSGWCVGVSCAVDAQCDRERREADDSVCLLVAGAVGHRDAIARLDQKDQLLERGGGLRAGGLGGRSDRVQHGQDPSVDRSKPGQYDQLDILAGFGCPPRIAWVDEPVPGYAKRPVPRNEDAVKALKKRTLTNLYNARPQWLADAHAALDAGGRGCVRLGGRHR